MSLKYHFFSPGIIDFAARLGFGYDRLGSVPNNNNNLSQIKENNPNNISIVSSKLCAVANNKRNNAYNFKWKYDQAYIYVKKRRPII